MKSPYKSCAGSLAATLSLIVGCIPLVPPDTTGNDLEGYIQTYGGATDEEVYSIVQTADDGFLLAGNIESTVDGISSGSAAPEADLLVIKTDANGVLQWKKTWGDEFRDSTIRALESPDGLNYYVAATRSTAADVYDGLVVKLDSNGDPLWTTIIGDADNEVIWNMTLTAAGEPLLVGVTVAAGGSFYDLTADLDVIVIKVDADGAILWRQEFDTATGDVAFDILELPNGEIAVLGCSNEVVGDELDNDTFIWRLDEDGNLLEQQTIVQEGIQSPLAFVQMPDGGYMIASSSTESGQRDIHLLRTERDGTLRWSNLYGGDGVDTGFELVATADGGAVLVGTDVTGDTTGDVFLLRVDRNGDTVWRQILGGVGANAGTCLAATPTGFAVAGYTDVFGAGGYDPFLIFFDQEGALVAPTTTE